jgi:hypothetical protein
VRAFELLDLVRYLDPNVERSEKDLEELRARLLPYRHQIRSIFGITVSEEGSAVKLLGAFLDRLGLKLEYIGRFGSRDDRQRYYRLTSLDPDGRGEIFERWKERDLSSVSTSLVQDHLIPVPDTPPVPEEWVESVKDAREMLETAIGQPVGLTREVMDAIVSGFAGVKDAGRWVWKTLSFKARNWVQYVAPDGYRWLSG